MQPLQGCTWSRGSGPDRTVLAWLLQQVGHWAGARTQRAGSGLVPFSHSPQPRDPCVLCVPLMCAGGGCFFHVCQTSSRAREGETLLKHTFHPGAVDRPVNSFPRPLSKELAESLTTAGLAPGLCSGFCESSQLMPNSQLSSSFNTFVCGLKEDGAVTSVPETYWVLNQHYCKAVLE